MAERLENSEEVSKNTESGACRASREGRVPCPHNDCHGNAVFFQRGAGLDVHFRAKHGAKPDATTEKAAKQKPPPSLLARVFLGLGTGKEVKQLKLDELPEFGLGQNSASPVLCNVKLWDHILKK
ncbi:hypothetical protein Bbelb_241640 [Branchiostoma belcheri]|nr:hypothetical protein Bbelb_241640 [Branchiostoma belcheri]